MSALQAIAHRAIAELHITVASHIDVVLRVRKDVTADVDGCQKKVKSNDSENSV